MDALMTRSRARRLDDALSSDSPDPDFAAELELAALLREAGSAGPRPSPEFRTALRTRLMAVAAVQGVGSTAATPVPAAAPAGSWRSRAAAVAVGVTATAVTASGVAVASSQSLPGDPFYGVKRTAEDLQLRLADGSGEQGRRHLQFAAERLSEVRALADGSEDDVEQRVTEALTDMDAATRDGQRLLVDDFRDTREAGPLLALRRFAEEQDAGLREVLPRLTGTALERAQGSLVLLQGTRGEAQALLLLLDCTAACDPAQTAPALPGAQETCDCPPSPGTAGPQPAPAQPSAPAPAPTAPQPPAPAPAAPQPGDTGAPAPVPPAAPQPQPLPPLPDAPLPGAPLPVPTLPTVELPGAPLPSVELPAPGEVLDGVVDPLTGVLPGT